VLVCYLDFWSLVFVCHLRFAIWNFRVSAKWVKYGAFFPNFKLPFLGTELMRRGTSSSKAFCQERSRHNLSGFSIESLPEN